MIAEFPPGAVPGALPPGRAPLTLYYDLHPVTPQRRLIRQAVEIVRRGGVIAYPTDSCYALGCHIGDKDALERIRRIRRADRHHHFTLVCRDLTEIARYARVDTWQFRLLKACTPGPYTFLLAATRETPRRLQHEKRKTIGIRVPDHVVPRLLLEELGEPIMSSTLMLPGEEAPLTDPHEIKTRLEHMVDLVIDGGPGGVEASSVVDLTGEAPVVVRRGKGDVSTFE
jgi:tRNA threonylcarbamoyl adenosine modification protein (Sua5/YciO/YrdC/YwlC family)